MTPQRTVVIMTTLSLLIFLTAGGRADQVVAKLRGAAPPAPSKKLDAGTLVGWAFLFTFLIILADLPPTSKLGQAFSLLIALSVAVAYGPQAFDNISNLVGETSGGGMLQGPPGGGGSSRSTRRTPTYRGGEQEFA